MPTTTVNPTRMELTRLKGRLRTAQRGHKLLKDKRDGLMKQFMQEVRRTRQLRKRVEEGLAQANAAFTVASAVMSPEMLEQVRGGRKVLWQMKKADPELEDTSEIEEDIYGKDN